MGKTRQAMRKGRGKTSVGKRGSVRMHGTSVALPSMGPALAPNSTGLDTPGYLVTVGEGAKRGRTPTWGEDDEDTPTRLQRRDRSNVTRTGRIELADSG
eukprot:scaffold1725_cov355-Pavlova_lutheri.AAC.5